jgi:hypothetical protein
MSKTTELIFMPAGLGYAGAGNAAGYWHVVHPCCCYCCRRDVLNFLANTECLEATFNTYAAFGAGLPASLKPGAVIGGK